MFFAERKQVLVECSAACTGTRQTRAMTLSTRRAEHARKWGSGASSSGVTFNIYAEDKPRWFLMQCNWEQVKVQAGERASTEAPSDG